MKKLDVQTSAMDLPDTVSAQNVDVLEGMPESAAELALLDTVVPTRPGGVFGEAACTEQPLLDGGCGTDDVPLSGLRDDPVATFDIPVEKGGHDIPTRNLPISDMPEPRAVTLGMYSEDIPTHESGIVDGYHHTREMANLKFMDYPAISEYVRKIAEENKMQYSQIKLLGIYEPIPLHLAYGLTLDPLSGKLRFRMRRSDNPRKDRRMARVAYARVRLTNEIVQAVFPVT